MPLERRGTQDWLRPGCPTCLRPDPSPHYTAPPQESSCPQSLINLYSSCFKGVVNWGGSQHTRALPDIPPLVDRVSAC
ncbi:unnamed protein product [Mesocestoides corti]|uniref:Uncharacterized protein n=1 Tax=Mesocestoides corti TaxID=53468 RepID=A0A0R3U2R0_MESCO|nr:unnamed protein product [Mesocestoides corti]